MANQKLGRWTTIKQLILREQNMPKGVGVWYMLRLDDMNLLCATWIMKCQKQPLKGDFAVSSATYVVRRLQVLATSLYSVL